MKQRAQLEADILQYNRPLHRISVLYASTSMSDVTQVKSLKNFWKCDSYVYHYETSWVGKTIRTSVENTQNTNSVDDKGVTVIIDEIFPRKATHFICWDFHFTLNQVDNDPCSAVKNASTQQLVQHEEC